MKNKTIGYFLQTNRSLIRNEFSLMIKLYKKYVTKSFAKKINTFDGMSDGMSDEVFFIDFNESKKSSPHKEMMKIIKKAAKDDFIPKDLANAFVIGKITEATKKGKIIPVYEKIKIKKQRKSTAKKQSIGTLKKNVRQFICDEGYRIKEFVKTKKNTYSAGLYKGGKVELEKTSTGYMITFNKTKCTFLKIGLVNLNKFDKIVLSDMISYTNAEKFFKKDPSSKSTTLTIKRGAVFSITGTLPLPRKKLIDMMEKLGGVYQNHISKETKTLYVGKKPGKTKLAKAKKYGITITNITKVFEF